MKILQALRYLKQGLNNKKYFSHIKENKWHKIATDVKSQEIA